jgi:hypothetical protein
MPDHAYDNPELDSLQFLEAVMRDENVPIELRLKAAEGLLPYQQPKPKPSLVPWKTKNIPGNEDVTITVRIPSVFNSVDTPDDTDTPAQVEGHA